MIRLDTQVLGSIRRISVGLLFCAGLYKLTRRNMLKYGEKIRINQVKPEIAVTESDCIAGRCVDQTVSNRRRCISDFAIGCRSLLEYLPASFLVKTNWKPLELVRVAWTQSAVGALKWCLP